MGLRPDLLAQLKQIFLLQDHLLCYIYIYAHTDRHIIYMCVCVYVEVN